MAEIKPIRLYRPSSGFEGIEFFHVWCSNCARDKPMSEGKDFDACEPHEICELIGRSMCYRIDEDGYPQEWQYGPDDQPMCSAFVPLGEQVRTRCTKTVDMFDDQTGT